MKRRRCEKHGELYGVRCVQCENEALRARVAELEKQIADVWGPSRTVIVGYPMERVFSPLLHALGLKSEYMLRSDDVLRIGHKNLGSEWKYQVPENFALALVKCAQVMDEQVRNLEISATQHIARCVAGDIDAVFGAMLSVKWTEAMRGVVDEALAGKGGATCSLAKSLEKALQGVVRESEKTELEE